MYGLFHYCVSCFNWVCRQGSMPTSCSPLTMAVFNMQFALGEGRVGLPMIAQLCSARGRGRLLQAQNPPTTAGGKEMDGTGCCAEQQQAELMYLSNMKSARRPPSLIFLPKTESTIYQLLQKWSDRSEPISRSSGAQSRLYTAQHLHLIYRKYEYLCIVWQKWEAFSSAELNMLWRYALSIRVWWCGLSDH